MNKAELERALKKVGPSTSLKQVVFQTVDERNYVVQSAEYDKERKIVFLLGREIDLDID